MLAHHLSVSSLGGSLCTILLDSFQGPNIQACLRALEHALLPGMSSADTHSQAHVSPFTTCQAAPVSPLKETFPDFFNKPTHPTLLLPIYRHLKAACEVSIHSFIDGRLGCFHVMPIVNGAALHIGVHMSF